MSDDLDLLRDAAHEAGRLALRPAGGAGWRSSYKADGSPVTNADLAVDDLLKRAADAPRGPTMAGCRRRPPTTPPGWHAAACSWSIPIDGTRAFLKGRPWWSVSVAVVEDGRPVAGVVYAPGWTRPTRRAAAAGRAPERPPIQASDAADLEACAMLGDARRLRRPRLGRALAGHAGREPQLHRLPHGPGGGRRLRRRRRPDAQVRLGRRRRHWSSPRRPGAIVDRPHGRAACAQSRPPSGTRA